MSDKNVISFERGGFHDLRMAYVGSESWKGPDYHWQNEGREGAHAIIQLTRKGRCFIDDSQGRHYVPAGSAFIVEVPSETAYGYVPGDTDPYELDFIAMFGELAIRFVRDLRAFYGPVFELSRRPESLAFFRQIMQKFKHNGFRDRYEESSLLYQFLSSLYREANQAVTRGDSVAACYQRIQSRYREQANINEIALDAGLSREHLARSFQARFGQSPSRMLRELRMREARLILQSGVQDLESVAAAVGFSDVRTLKRYL
ncbi:helix-turn-helix domain-containing protein [Coraliomargarita parva]|uniref:helix-turn-helix domain-containing protein n=1 Tax=Coraliomargarita parva TaxID=3014050 RepID=UPI0022B331E1|nr:AraC family transcriptional regulator [Coraliomargarita parva]